LRENAEDTSRSRRRPVASRAWIGARAGALVASVLVLTAPTFGESAAAVTVLPATTYTSNTTWTLANSPYVLNGDITVGAAATLTIEPGVIVKLNGQLRSIWVNGVLKAVGNASNRIVFTSYQDDSAGGDTNGDGTATSGALGQWSGFKVGSSNADTELKFVDVSYGGWGYSNSADTALSVGGSATVTVEDSTFINNERSGISVGPGSSNPGVIVRRSTIRLNGNGVSANQGWMKIEDRTLIQDNRADGVWFNLTSGYTGPASAILDSDVHRNAYRGVYLQVESGLDVGKWPRGNRNNIYENANKQLYLLQAKRTADWKHNYWGENVEFGYAPSGCRNGGQQSVGKLAFHSSQGNPPDGPIDSSVYYIFDPGFTACGYDRVEIGSSEFSRTYIGATPRLAEGQAWGPCVPPTYAKRPTVCSRDPVNTATGGFVHTRTDLSLPATGVPFTFTRTYNSPDTLSGPLGPGWTHAYATSLIVKTSGDVTLRGPDGQQVEYVKQPDGSYKGASGALATLTKPGSTYELVTNDQVKHVFDSAGRMTSMRDRNDQGLTFGYDGNGRLTTITDSANRTITLTYDAANRLTQVSVPDGRSVGYAYTNGRLTSVTDVTNRVWTYTYDQYGLLEKEIDPLNHTTVRNVYSRDGRVTEQYDALNNKTTFAWDAATQTATVTDARNNAWRDVYANNVLIRRTDPLNNTTEYGHDTSLNDTSVTAPGGSATTMTYDSRGNVLTATAPASVGGGQKSFVYDGQNNVTTVTDARGKVATYTYDAAGNPTSVVEDGQTVAAYTYDAAGRMTSTTDGRNNTTTFTYDASGNVVSVTDALGNKATFAYDAAGRLTSRVEPRGNVQGADPNLYRWVYTYDAAGRMLTSANPLGQATTSAYDAAGNQTSVTDANNRVTAFTYDAANRLLTETAPDNGVTTHTYDAVGNNITEKDPTNNTTTYSYDAANRLESLTTPLGNKTTYQYDASNNLIKRVEPRGNVQGANPNDYATTFAYDAAGRLLTETDPLANTTTYTYDAVGNRTGVTDANNHTTTYAYDGRNRLLSTTAPGNATTAYVYDAAGNLISRTDANNHATSYNYDAADRVVSKTLPLNRQWTFAYDAAGNRIRTVDANGNATQTAGDGTTDYGYDRAGRLTTIAYSDATPDVSFAYDAGGNRTQMTDGSGAQTYAYDAVNRLTQVTRGSDTFAYTYDAAGKLTRRTYPDGTVVDLGYDQDSRLLSVASGGQTTGYGYDASGNLTQTTLPAGNGHVEERTYDRAGRLVRVKTVKNAAVLTDLSYTLDAVGNPTQVVRTGSAAGTTTFAYDTRDRLTQVCFQASCPGGSDPFIRWTYDTAGNRLSEERPTGTVSYTYNAADQLTQSGAITYGYDANGNQTAAGARSFGYDLANRLETTTASGQTTTYAYDGDGNRMQASAGGQLTNYVWDRNYGLPQLALERSGPGATLRRYLYGNARISMTASGSTFYFHHDAIGSVTNVTSSTGAAQWTYAYEPFGATRTETQDDPSAPFNPMKYAGELLDATGLYHVRARQYDPGTGRFLARDPLEFAAGKPAISAYAYADNRPTTSTDPSGLFAVTGPSVAAFALSPSSLAGFEDLIRRALGAYESRLVKHCLSAFAGFNAAGNTIGNPYADDVAECVQVAQAAQEADALAAERVPGDLGADGRTNAFRHALWNALIVLKFKGKADRAKFLTDLNEQEHPQGRHDVAAKIMDLHNNAVGRALATALLAAGGSYDELKERAARILERAVEQRGARAAGSSLWILAPRNCVKAVSTGRIVPGVVRWC
jgi:RHS repeat-associated protein